ncbi:MAG: hypothetical protein ACUVRO_13525 [Armatimonadota bacterium]
MERAGIKMTAAVIAGAAVLFWTVSAALAAGDLVTTTVQADKTSAKAGETVTFTVTLKNNDADQPITVMCSTTYLDPSTGQTVTAVSNALQLTRLGWRIVAPMLKIPIDPTLEFEPTSFTVDGSPVTPSVDGNTTVVPVPDLSAGQSRVVRWQATVR